MHHKTIALSLAALLLVGAATFWYLSRPAISPHPPSRPPVSRNLRYGFEVKNTTNRAIKEVEIHVFAPLQETPFQEVIETTSDVPFEVHTGSGVFTLSLPPFGTALLNVNSQVRLSSNPKDSGSESQSVSAFLEKEEYEVPALQELAERLRRETPPETARAIFDWVSTNMRPSNYEQEAKGALTALEKRSGDCTEYAALMIALARLNEIPARGVSGFYLERAQMVRPIDYHTWVELFIDDRWELYDPHKGNAQSFSERYVAFGNALPNGEQYGVSMYRFFTDHSEISIKMRS
ncbi:hypothetical protein MRY87_11365 [bacterium]|nr:hypothetical protein [bacterium]